MPSSRRSYLARLMAGVVRYVMHPSASRRWVTLAIGPFVFMAGYLAVSRWPVAWFSSLTDYLAVGAGLAIGLLALHGFDWRGSVKAYVAVVYVLAMATGLIYFSVLFVCAIFGRCI